MTHTIISTIRNDLAGDLSDTDHHVYRYFTLWLDGSYDGEAHYRRNLATLNGAAGNPKALRSFIIQEFTKFTARDADCSFGYAQKAILKVLSERDLAILNEGLMGRAVDWAASQSVGAAQ